MSPIAVDDDWCATVQEDILKSEYHVTWPEQTYLDDLPNLSADMTTGAYQAPNRAANLRTYFAPVGPILIPRLWAEFSTSVATAGDVDGLLSARRPPCSL